MLRLDLYRRAAGFTPDARREGGPQGGNANAAFPLKMTTAQKLLNVSLEGSVG